MSDLPAWLPDQWKLRQAVQWSLWKTQSLRLRRYLCLRIAQIFTPGVRRKLRVDDVRLPFAPSDTDY